MLCPHERLSTREKIVDLKGEMNTPVMNDRLVMEDSPEERQAGQGALSYEETTLKKKKGPSCYSTPL